LYVLIRTLVVGLALAAAAVAILAAQECKAGPTGPVKFACQSPRIHFVPDCEEGTNPGRARHRKQVSVIARRSETDKDDRDEA